MDHLHDKLNQTTFGEAHSKVKNLVFSISTNTVVCQITTELRCCDVVDSTAHR